MPDDDQIPPAWSAAIAAYRRELETRQASPNTLRAYSNDLRELALWAGGVGIADPAALS